MAIDISRMTEGVDLPAEVSREILGAAQSTSAVMSLAKQVSLPGRGITVPVLTGRPQAQWVNETDNKPVSGATLGNKSMTPHKLAVIVPFSNEFKRDATALYNAIVQQLPGALAEKFDAAVLRNEDTPTGNFDTLADAEAVSLADDVYAGLLAAHQKVGKAGGRLNGYALAAEGEGALYGAMDGTGRPLFDFGQRSILGAPVASTDGVYVAGGEDEESTVGIAGDWTKAWWGTVEGVQIRMTDQATLTDGDVQINLFQRNMFAVLAEVEVGFITASDDAFVRFTA